MQQIDAAADAGPTEAVGPRGLVPWDYWLNAWPSGPVALTRANAADGYPKALTPLSQDLVLRFEEAGVRRFYFESLKALRAGDCPAPFMQAYYGLVYLNADQMGDLGDAMPGSTRFGVFQTILGLEPDPGFALPTPTLRQRLSEARAGARVGPRVLRLASRAKARIDAQIAEIEEVRPANPDSVTRGEARAWLARLEALQVPAWETLMIGTAIAMAFFESTEKAISRFAGGDGRDLTNRLHVGLGGNESAESGLAIRSLAELARARPATLAALERHDPVATVAATDADFAAALQRVIVRFGHRAPAELEIANPSWRADPAQLLDVVRIELQRAAPTEAADAIRTDAEAELASRVKGIKAGVVGVLLRRSRDLMAVRENGKVPAVRLFDETRRLLAAVAPGLVHDGVLPDAGAATLLRYDELCSVLAGGGGPGLAELGRRRVEHDRCLGLDLPELVLADAAGLHPLDDGFMRERGLLPPGRVDLAAERLEGIGASPGQCTGTTRVLLDPFEDFEPGDVLFAKTVDPGWAPVLSCAGAVVLDMGGLMSHGAVVARELGIPCVVNVKSGTTVADRRQGHRGRLRGRGPPRVGQEPSSGRFQRWLGPRFRWSRSEQRSRRVCASPTRKASRPSRSGVSPPS